MLKRILTPLVRIPLVFLALLSAAALPAAALPACDLTLSPGQDIASALGNGGTSFDPWVVCLNSGTWNLSSNLYMPDHSELRGVYNRGWFSKIQSTADRNIVISNRTGVTLRHLIIDGSTTASTYNVLVYRSSHVQVRQNLIRYSKTINVGMNGGSDYVVADNTIAFQGYGSSRAEPSIWNSGTSRVTIERNTIYGRANGPGGDGEVASYNCDHLNLRWNYIINSGASTVYVVNCGYGTIENNTLTNPGEWGLDLVQGTHDFQVRNNQVTSAYFGSVVVSDAGMNTVQSNIHFSNNRFYDGNSSGVANCACINIDYATSTNITQTGTTCRVGWNNAPPTCSWGN